MNGGPGLVLRRRDGEVIGVLGIEVGPTSQVDPRHSGGPRLDALWLTTATRSSAHWNRRRPDGD